MAASACTGRGGFGTRERCSGRVNEYEPSTSALNGVVNPSQAWSPADVVQLDFTRPGDAAVYRVMQEARQYPGPEVLAQVAREVEKVRGYPPGEYWEMRLAETTARLDAERSVDHGDLARMQALALERAVEALLAYAAIAFPRGVVE